MKEMRIYIANDDTQFHNKHDCLKHELEQRLINPSLQIYKDDTVMTDLMSAKTYQECNKVNIPNIAALKDMLYIQHFTGFYHGIDAVGTWTFDNDECIWTKQEKEEPSTEFNTTGSNNSSLLNGFLKS